MQGSKYCNCYNIQTFKTDYMGRFTSWNPPIQLINKQIWLSNVYKYCLNAIKIIVYYQLVFKIYLLKFYKRMSNCFQPQPFNIHAVIVKTNENEKNLHLLLRTTAGYLLYCQILEGHWAAMVLENGFLIDGYLLFTNDT